MAAFMKTVALAGALFTVAGVAAPAAPLDKRDVVWETVTDIVWTTIDVTTTLYPGQPTATVETYQTTAEVSPTLHAAHHQHNHYHGQGTTLTTSSSTEAEAEPTTSSSSSTVEPVAAVVTSSSSSEAAAPVVTSSSEAPTTTAAPIVQAVVESTSTSSTAAAATSASSSSSSSGYSGSCAEGSPCVGDITYYDTATLATNPSYCDTTNDGSTELVLALPVGIMTESDCGKTVTITYNGVTKTGTVVDKCMGCDDTSIDLSRALFDVFAAETVGRATGASWYIN